MKHPLRSIAYRQANRLVGNVAIDDFETRVIDVVDKVLAPAGDEIVEHAHASALAQQRIDKMASNEAGSAGDNIQHFLIL